MIIYNVCELRENTRFIFFFLYKYRLSKNPKKHNNIISLQIQRSAMDDICSGFAYWPSRYSHLFICNRQDNDILDELCKPMFLKNIAMK